jgi:glycerol-3-phosphate dehydrogenase
MVQRLADVVLRRVGAGVAGHITYPFLQRCAEIMARELNWSAARRERELAELRGALPAAGEPLVALEVGAPSPAALVLQP